MFIYEAGSLTKNYSDNTFYLATEWREKLDEWGKDNDVKRFNPAITYLTEKNHTYNSRFCVDQNRYYLDKADIMIVDLNNIEYSPGTIWELCYASEVRKIPIIAFGNPTWSPHVMYGINQVCKDIDEVIEVLSNMFGQCLK
jgi:nucleoside 2-deoxyribosyltransferase